MRIEKQTILFLLIFLIGCTEKKIDEKLIFSEDGSYIKRIYEDEVLKTEQQFYKNSRGEETARGYFKEYYPNGVLSKEYNWFDNKLLGNQIEYDKEGDETKAFIISEDGSRIFNIEVNQDGSIKEMYGIPLHLNRRSNPVRRSDPFLMYYGVIASRSLKSSLRRSFINPEGRQTLDTLIDNFSSDGRDFFIEKVIFEDTGIYLNVIEVELKNKNGIVLNKTKITDTIKVIE